jgi:hypothetical protein
MSYSGTDFYNNELDRLKQKHDNATSILSSKQRISFLNDSYRKRYAKYVEMLMVLVLCFLAYLGVRALGNAFPVIPQIAVDVITAALIAVVLIYSLNAVYELSTRSVLNYDELDLPAYDPSGGVDPNAAANSGRINPDLGNTCVGQECCDTGYTWNLDQNKCKPNPVQSFTTLEQAYSNTKFDSPELKRAPSNSAEPTVVATSLIFSKF